ncbi:FxSxx-COOH system tetratricopeptide repeat protein [Priestia aryabhattai]|uniref:FxSxx-COOH system tetratricopeptide repeat protein n=1 Tax=Priestia aryabhattai TaxID=412384 RepID=UPI003D2A9AFE
MPYKRNPFFLGREGELVTIEKSLLPQNSVTVIQAVSGLGGVGKTQIAVEYCYRKKDSYKLIWWINAENATSISASYEELANELKLPIKDEKENYIAVQVIKTWMERNHDWLVVFDNLADEQILDAFLPTTFLGNIIITTRKSNISSLINPLNIDKFIREDSIEFLLKRTNREKDSRRVSSQLAELLGDLPLALEQASAYIIQTGISISSYIERFNKYRDQLIKKGKPINYDYNLATTWEISFEELNKQNPIALRFIYLCSFLSPDEISLNIFNNYSESPNFIKENIPSELELDELLSLLRAFSLIKSSQYGFSIHRLVQAVIIDKLPISEKDSLIKVALELIRNSWHSFNLNKHSIISHTLIVTEHAINNNIYLEKATELLNFLGLKLIETGEYKRAKEIISKALDIDRKLYKQDELLSRDYHHLAISCIKLSEFEEAEYYLGKCLDIKLTDKHKVFNYLNTLASLKRDQGKFAESIDIYIIILDYMEKNKKIPVRDMYAVYNNLALSLDEVGENDKAEEYYRSIIEVLKEVENEGLKQHLAQVYSNLSLLLEKMGRYVEAKESILQSIKLVNEHLDGSEILLMQYYNNIGYIYLRTYQYITNIKGTITNELDLAKKYLIRASRLFRKLIGENYLEYCSLLNNLGMVYEKEGNISEAKKKFNQGIKIIKKIFGQTNHHMLSNLESNLGSLIWMSGDFKTGEKLLISALERDVSIFGECHSEVAMDLDKLAFMYFNVKDYEKSADYYKKSYNISEKTLGSLHPLTVMCLESLFNVHILNDTHIEAQKIYPRLLRDTRKLYGENHSKVVALKKFLQS